MTKILTLGLILMMAGTAWAQPEPDMAAMMQQMLGGMTQGEGSTEAPATISLKALKNALPKDVPGYERVEAGAEKQGVMGLNTVIATGVYENGAKTIRVEFTDLSGMGAMGAMAMMGWTSTEVDKETRTGFERTADCQGFKSLETFDKADQRGEIEVFVDGRINVKVSGSGLESFEELSGAATALDLAALAALKPETAPAP